MLFTALIATPNVLASSLGHVLEDGGILDFIIPISLNFGSKTGESIFQRLFRRGISHSGLLIEFISHYLEDDGRISIQTLKCLHLETMK